MKAQDSDLPTFQMRASYPTIYLPLGRSASRSFCSGARKEDAICR